MGAKLSCVLVALLLVGADSSPTSSAGTQLVFPPGSRWQWVKGRQGELDLTVGCVSFLKDGELSLSWYGIERNAFAKCGFCRAVKSAYEPDPRNNLTILLHGAPRDRIKGHGRLLGNLLEIRIPRWNYGSTYCGPGGETDLLFRRAN